MATMVFKTQYVTKIIDGQSSVICSFVCANLPEVKQLLRKFYNLGWIDTSENEAYVKIYKQEYKLLLPSGEMQITETQVTEGF